ncbi:DNA polymerase III beta subunit-like protein [Fontibacillus phaseoli]|uniref:DNA polymerase III beta subunit-like protein n=1 Tax=Fontibacillus phaseoli TaxID=1416533 RepID=A0A369BQN0_9BACL|nr:hypothetical protein [Fontibacillus phaseoli]RCX22906.1 DNA polymerase III beta subunit-like protein [Fontibacillus phaseoli]
MAITQAKKLELITKHAKNFTTKSEATPVLQGVHYAADGSVVCTDRVTLLRIGGAHNFTEAFTSHAKTGAVIDGVFPDTSRIVPQELPTQITLVDTAFFSGIKDAIARVKVALETAKLSADKSHITRLDVAQGSGVKLTVNLSEDNASFAAMLTADTFGKDAAVAFNAQLFLNALNVFKDAGSQRVIVGITGEATPIVLRDEENEIDAIVLPYRVAKEAA